VNQRRRRRGTVAFALPAHIVTATKPAGGAP
jgi:hypothetical protein